MLKEKQKINHKQSLLNKFARKTAKIGIVGLGYVGLPIAHSFANQGFKVTGIDINDAQVSRIQSGISNVLDLPSSELAKVTENNMLKATSDFSVVKDLDVIVICVPTPLTRNREPDISSIKSVLMSIVPFIHSGQLISLESTTFPGTTEEVILPCMESSNLAVGEELFIVYSPERVDPGNTQYKIHNTPKIIGGITPECTKVGEAFYKICVEKVIPVSNTRTAEITKVFENTFRGINIAVVNELALLCDKLDINVWEVIEAASTKPFGFTPFYPGPGIGGHCIPIDPFYLSWKAREFNFTTRFIELAGEINSSMPSFVREKVIRALGKHYKSLNGSKVLIIGVGYKKDQATWVDAPSRVIFDNLYRDGVQLYYHDPYAKDFKDKADRTYDNVELSKNMLNLVDCVLILTPHTCIDYDLIAREAPLIVDSCNAMKDTPVSSEKIILL